MYSSYVVTKSAKVLKEVLSDVLEDASNELAGLARLVVQRAKEQWAELDAHIQWCDERIAAHLKQNEQVRQAEQLKGVGPVTASPMPAHPGATAGLISRNPAAERAGDRPQASGTRDARPAPTGIAAAPDGRLRHRVRPASTACC